MTLFDVERRLRAVGIENAACEALWLSEHFTKLSELRLRAGEVFENAALEEAIERRCGRYPLQYLLGEWPFYRQTYRVTPDALIPRSDTEVLVAEAIRRLPKGAHFADLCTGSGCIAISVLAERPDTTAVAVDKFEATLALARENAVRNRVSERLTPLLCDLLRPDLQIPLDPFDAVLCNPPYIRSEVIRTLEPELSAEPRAALDGGEDGLIFYRTLLSAASFRIKPNGFFLFEIGYDQADALRALGQEHGFAHIEIGRDLSGNDRTVLLSRGDA